MQPADFNDLQELWKSTDSSVDYPMGDVSQRMLRKQRLIEAAELFLGGALLVMVALASFRVGTLPVMLTGAAIAILIIYSGWSRYRSRRVEELVDIRGQHAYLTQLLIGKRARLRRLVFGLLLFFPALVLGDIFGSMTGISGDQIEHALSGFGPGMQVAFVVVTLFTIIAPIAWLLRAILRQRTEIKQVEAMLESFDDELEKDALEL